MTSPQPTQATQPPQYAQPATGGDRYAVPAEFDRGYGRPTPDVRGYGYYLAVGSIASGIFALGSTMMFFGFSGLSAIPAIMAIVCGIMGLRGAEKPHPTPFSSQAKQFSIWGIVCGALSLFTIIGVVALFGVLTLMS